ncbi:MAG: hypothetical protein JWM52_683 [Candidatus Saccharibacteria bacterium]|nr:hypothetical protein [Candidatus Saccharibacteria bacterium]
MTPDTQNRFDKAVQLKPDYQPNAETKAILQSKTILEIIAPAAEGKSSIMLMIEHTNKKFSFVNGFTTRKKEARDPEHLYKYVNSEEELNELFDRIEQGSLVQYIQHPTTKQLYGSFPEDYENDYSMLDVLSSAVAFFEVLPFKRKIKIALVSKGNEWIKRLLARYPEPNEERTKRVNEALQSLGWVLEQPKDSLVWIENKAGDMDYAVNRIIDLIENDQPSEDLSYLAQEMYDEARKVA